MQLKYQRLIRLGIRALTIWTTVIGCPLTTQKSGSFPPVINPTMHSNAKVLTITFQCTHLLWWCICSQLCLAVTMVISKTKCCLISKLKKNKYCSFQHFKFFFLEPSQNKHDSCPSTTSLLPPCHLHSSPLIIISFFRPLPQLHSGASMG